MEKGALNQSKIKATMLALLLITTITLASGIQPVKATGGTIYIRADGSIYPPAPIKRDGNLYTFTADIYDSIVVERDNIVIDGAGYTIQGTGDLPESGIGISLSGRTNVTVRNTQIKNFWDGIYLNSSSSNIISGNNITNISAYGILLDDSSNNVVSGNTFTYCGLVVVWGSYRNVVENNTVNGKPLVYLEDVVDYSVGDAGQVILVNCDGIRVENLDLVRTSIGVELWKTNNSIISRNSIDLNNMFGVWLYSSFNNSVSGNAIAFNKREGILLDRCSNNRISGNDIANNYDDGVWLCGSSNNIISGNYITNDGYGVGVKLWPSSNYNNVSGNYITNNNFGIYLRESSSNNIISGNDITANDAYGVWLGYSSNNWFYHNNFIDNGVQAYMPAGGERINVWDDDYPSGGNYWSDYKGVDLYGSSYQNIAGSDGISDTPYVIDENNADRYPLMAPFTAFNVGVWNGIEYFVDVVSNSSVSNFIFDPSKGPFLKFNVTGDDGTIGFCRVTIPKSLLWAEDGWIITVGNQQITNYTIIPDENYTYLYFTYSHSTRIVTIQGTHVIPELSSAPILLLFMIVSTMVIILRKNKPPKNKSKNQLFHL